MIIDNVLKIASNSNPNSVAGMIAALVREGTKDIKLQCIGAACVNQAIKAIAIARGFVAPSGYDLIVKPIFDTINIDDRQRTGISLIVEVM